MKRLIIGFTVVAGLLTSVASCQIEGPSGQKRPTENGYRMFTTVTDHWYNRLNLLEAVLNLNVWLGASSEEERYQIEDRWFTTYKIRQKGNVYSLIFSGQVVYSIDTEGKMLPDAENGWKVIWKGEKIRVVRHSENSWKIEDENGEYLLVTSEASSSESLTSVSFSIEGKGKIMDNYKRNDISYEVKKPFEVKALNDSYAFISNLTAGKMEMEAKDVYTNKTGKAFAEIVIVGDGVRRVRIQFNNETEDWY